MVFAKCSESVLRLRYRERGGWMTYEWDTEGADSTLRVVALKVERELTIVATVRGGRRASAL